jgi:hypothetical protein
VVDADPDEDVAGAEGLGDSYAASRGPGDLHFITALALSRRET